MSTAAAVAPTIAAGFMLKQKIAAMSPITMMAAGRLLYNGAATGVAYYSLGSSHAVSSDHPFAKPAFRPKSYILHFGR